MKSIIRNPRKALANLRVTGEALGGVSALADFPRFAFLLAIAFSFY